MTVTSKWRGDKARAAMAEGDDRKARKLVERAAELAEMPLMLLVIVAAARFIVRRFALRPSWHARLGPGLLALALLLGAELLLAVVLQDQSLAAYVASRDPVSGTVYLAMLSVFALMPWLLGRLPGGDAPR